MPKLKVPLYTVKVLDYLVNSFSTSYDSAIGVENFDRKMAISMTGEFEEGVYAGEIPGALAGDLVSYYISAEAATEAGTLAFSPEGAEHDLYQYRVDFPISDGTNVVINEFMADNESVIADPQGEFDDWIELKNLTAPEVDLSGYYLSDNEDNPRKWRFPDGTTIPANGYLILWADEDGSADAGLHANFKLSSGGEIILLSDTDEIGNGLLDSVTFGQQTADISTARLPDGSGDFGPAAATPGATNDDA